MLTMAMQVKVVRMAQDRKNQQFGKNQQFVHQLHKLHNQTHASHRGSVTFVSGTARFETANQVRVQPSNRIISADNFVVATGSYPRAMPGVPFDGKRILSSDHIMSLEKFPSSMLVVGAGYASCQLLLLYRNEIGIDA